MDPIAPAASAIAVIDLTAKVASLCFQYSKAAKSARSDIERLCRRTRTAEDLLEGARQLLTARTGRDSNLATACAMSSTTALPSSEGCRRG